MITASHMLANWQVWVGGVLSIAMQFVVVIASLGVIAAILNFVVGAFAATTESSVKKEGRSINSYQSQKVSVGSMGQKTFKNRSGYDSFRY